MPYTGSEKQIAGLWLCFLSAEIAASVGIRTASYACSPMIPHMRAREGVTGECRAVVYGTPEFGLIN